MTDRMATMSSSTSAQEDQKTVSNDPGTISTNPVSLGEMNDADSANKHQASQAGINSMFAYMKVRETVVITEAGDLLLQMAIHTPSKPSESKPLPQPDVIRWQVSKLVIALASHILGPILIGPAAGGNRCSLNGVHHKFHLRTVPHPILHLQPHAPIPSALRNKIDQNDVTKILQILHHKGEKLPQIVTLTQLGNIAAYSHWLGCTAAVGPWLRIWVENADIPSRLSKTMSIQDLLSMLKLSYVLADHAAFRYFSRRVLLAMQSNENFSAQHDIFLDMLKGRLLEIQHAELKALNVTIENILEKYGTSAIHSCPVESRCVAMVYGLLLAELRKCGLSVPRAIVWQGLHWEGSLIDLYTLLYEIVKKVELYHQLHADNSKEKHFCSYQPRIYIVEKISSVAKETQGLNLTQFRPNVSKLFSILNPLNQSVPGESYRELLSKTEESVQSGTVGVSFERIGASLLLEFLMSEGEDP